MRCVFDGLDECDDKALRIVQHILEQLDLEAQSKDFKTVLTFRPEGEVANQLRGYIATESLTVDLLKEGGLWRDLNAYIYQRVKTLSLRQGMSDATAREVQNALCKEQHGNAYLWSILVLQVLEKLPTIKKINEFLKNLPLKLPDIYHHIINGVALDRQKMIKKALYLIACARRPLKTSELGTFLAYADQKPLEGDARLGLDEYLRNELPGLLIFQTEGVLFVHQTLRQHVGKMAKKAGVNLEHMMAKLCLRLLCLQEEFSHRADATVSANNSLEYAMLYWVDHLRASGKRARDLGGPVKELWSVCKWGSTLGKSFGIPLRTRRTVSEIENLDLNDALIALGLAHVLGNRDPKNITHLGSAVEGDGNQLEEGLKAAMEKSSVKEIDRLLKNFQGGLE